MKHQPPDFLIDALRNGGRGYQAFLAKAARMPTDQLSKVKSGARALKHDEAERLRAAIAGGSTLESEPEMTRPLDRPEGSAVVSRIVGNRPSKDRPAELVFLLEGRDYLIFQLEPRHLAELRAALDQMEAR